MLAMECGLIRQDLDKFRVHVTSAENCFKMLLNYNAQLKYLMAWSEEDKNRLCHNNVRVVGLPEGAEGLNPTSFAEKFFQDILTLQQVSSAYIVECAHRLPMGPRPQGVPPKAVTLV